MTVGKYLRNENPDDRALAYGVCRDECENTRGNDGVVRRKKCPRDQPKGHNVAKRTYIQKRPPSQAVNQPESDEGEHQVGYPNSHRLQQRGLGPEPGKLKESWSEVQDCVNARQLVEECNQNRKQNGPAELAGPEIPGGTGFFRSGSDLVGLGGDHGLGCARLNPLQDAHGCVAVPLSTQQPTRALGQRKAKQ